MTHRIAALKSISKAYPGTVAADAVSMDFFSGEVVGLVGKNGAGKSTIIRIMAGVEIADHGVIAVEDSIFAHLTAHEATSLGLSFVHQELNDVPLLSVAENILLGLGYPKWAAFWIDRAKMYERARQVLAKIHMDIDPARLVSTLSMAERRMVMIARALASDAKMIVMDEPSASLTDSEIEELHTVVRKLKRDGVCVVYVSHRLQEIAELTDRVIVMRDGRVVGTASTGDIDQAHLVEMIVGTTVSSQHQPTCQMQFKADRTVPALEVQNLDPHNLGASISLAVTKGEILGLAGLAGSGRTETVRQIVGADRADGLRHVVDGEQVAISSPADALAHGIALVPEDRRNEGALLGFSIAHNITLSSLRTQRLHRTYPLPSAQRERRTAQTFFDRLAIKAPSAACKVAELSGGNQQKVVLARCLAADVDVLILDEPTHGIDVGAKAEIYGLIEQFAAEGKSIILISSDLQELTRLADRAIILREGLAVGELVGDELTEHAVLEMCFQSHLETA